MIVSTPAQKKLQGRVVALSVACPVDECNPPECPFHKLRKLPLRDRYEWVKGISEEEALRLLAFHEKCVEEKISGLPSWQQKQSE